jgi:hypothetical protein
MVFVYNCIKVFNGLASVWEIFPDPGNSVDLDINISEGTVTRLFPLKIKSMNRPSDKPNQLIHLRIVR